MPNKPVLLTGAARPQQTGRALAIKGITARMMLNLESAQLPTKRVYDLAQELKENPQRVALTQALTLNKDKPSMGLRGSSGLFASLEWWESIKSGRMKSSVVSGIVERTYFAGQDSRWGDQANSFVLRLDDGSLVSESIYTNQRSDEKLFTPGARVLMAYALDELKAQPAPDGGVNYSKVVLEVAVSTRPHS